MEDLAIILDGRSLTTYPLGTASFFAGTERIVKELAHGLAARGHIVHVITPDLPHEQQRGEREWWWPASYHPHVADVVVPVFSLETVGDLSAPFMVLLANVIDPPLGPFMPTAVACLTEAHKDLLCKATPAIQPGQCFITGTGCDPVLDVTTEHVYGRMVWSNSHDRGLWHMLDIFDRIKAKVPEATLHVGYDFDGKFEMWKWQAHSLAELMWEAKRRMEISPGITNVGRLTPEQVRLEQMESYIHVMPSDPPNVGSQLHGMFQLECAAAGVPLVLSDVEAFPEVFGECATILPVPGSLAKHDKKRVMVGRFDAQDWADVAVDIMTHKTVWQRMSRKSRAVAKAATWSAFLDRWETLFQNLIDARQQVAA